MGNGDTEFVEQMVSMTNYINVWRYHGIRGGGRNEGGVVVPKV